MFINAPNLRRVAACLTVVIVVTVTFIARYSTPSHAQFSSKDEDSIMMAGTITGRVFEDFNSNGLYETASGTNSIDAGVAGVTVSAYDSVGALQGSATTAANGTYSLVAGGTGPYRIEFTTLPSGYTPSARSTDSVLGGSATDAGSTVHFVNNLNTSNVNLAVTHQADYCQNNPTIVIPRYAQGASNGTYAANAVLYDFPYTAGTTYTDTTVANYDNPLTHALTTTAAAVGTVNSIEYNAATNRIYVASYFKKHSGFGPGADNILNNADDPGAIYVVNPATSAVVSTFTVPNATTNSHDVLDYASDNGNAGWDATGKTSLGGMALSDDNSRLFVMNLQDRRLYALNPTTGANLGSSAAFTSLTLPTPGGTSANCSSDDNERPFAVTFYRGTVYVGMVCTSESGTASATNLFAYVFAVNPTTLAITSTPVFSTPLNYTRGLADPGQDAEWRPWVATMQVNFAFPMPWLTDIEFENGNMILGIRDRTGDSALDAGPDGKRTAGDTIRACGSFGSWTVESNGRCGGTGTAPQNTGQGPGNGEFYHQDDFCATPNGGNFHDEISWGSLLYVPGRQHVISTLLDPISRTIDAGATFDGGIRLWNNNTGNADRAYRIYNGLGGVGQPDFGKTNGLGSLVAMCNQAPIEIGNRVWRDANGNGVQDPGENPIPNVTVRLYQGGTPVNYSVTPYTDTFPSIAYNGSSGTTNWAGTPWTEVSDDNDVTNGDVRVVSDLGTNALRLNRASNGASRTISLAGYNSAVLTYNYRRSGSLGATAEWFNGTTWTVLATYGSGTDAAYQASGSLVLPTNATAIRFMNGAANGNNDYFYVDNVQITAQSNTQVTDANGEYYFTSLQPNTAYQIRLDNPADYTGGGALASLILATQNQTSQLGDDDASDSDASTVSNPVGSPTGNFPVISHTTGGAGTNDHTLDIGFYLPPSASFASVSGRFLTSNGNGIRNVNVSLVQEDGTVHTTKTGSFGYYRFDDVIAGQTVVMTVNAKRYTFEPTTRIVSLTDELTDFDWISVE